MADEIRRENETHKQSGDGGGDGSRAAGGAEQTGDPGRTPGTAEGEEDTADQDIAQKLGGQG